MSNAYVAADLSRWMHCRDEWHGGRYALDPRDKLAARPVLANRDHPCLYSVLVDERRQIHFRSQHAITEADRSSGQIRNDQPGYFEKTGAFEHIRDDPGVAGSAEQCNPRNSLRMPLCSGHWLSLRNPGTDTPAGADAHGAPHKAAGCGQ